MEAMSVRGAIWAADKKDTSHCLDTEHRAFYKFPVFGQGIFTYTWYHGKNTIIMK